MIWNWVFSILSMHKLIRFLLSFLILIYQGCGKSTSNIGRQEPPLLWAIFHMKNDGILQKRILGSVFVKVI